MSTLPIPIDFAAGGVNRDYVSIFVDAIRRLPHFIPEWTYQGDDDFGIALLQLLCYIADHLHHRADTVVRDSRLAKTVHRFLAVEHAALLGYRARRATAAVTDVTLSIATPLATTLVIPQWTLLSANTAGGTVYFETTDAATILPGETSVSGVSVIEGRRYAGQVVGVASGRAFERFRLEVVDAVFNWLPGELVVYVNGVEATMVDWPFEATPEQLAYWVTVERGNALMIRFGDGTYGRRLPAGAEILATFRRGGGIRGRVAGTAINRVVSTIRHEGATIVVSVTNPNPTSGGLDAEDLESIRRRAPSVYATQNRYVTEDDYEAAALQVPGVYRANAVASGVDGVALYIAPDGAAEGGTLTNALRSRVLTAVRAKKLATDALAVIGATLVPIDVTLAIRAFPGFRNGVVHESVRATLEDEGGVLHLGSVDMGQQLWLSDTIGAVEGVAGVNNLDALKFTRRPELRWVTRIGNAELSADGVAINDDTQEQVWTITFLGTDAFTVQGSISGIQQNLGALDAVYVDDNGEISFTIESGTESMSEGDRGEIRTSKIAWNVNLAPFELPVPGAISVHVSGGID